MMKAYKVIKEKAISNSVVKELNAAVLTATFKTKKGIHKADLYSTNSKVFKLVSHGHCKPVNTTFVKTINICF